MAPEEQERRVQARRHCGPEALNVVDGGLFIPHPHLAIVAVPRQS